MGGGCAPLGKAHRDGLDRDLTGWPVACYTTHFKAKWWKIMIKELADMAERIEKKTDVSPLGKKAFLSILRGDYKQFDRLHVHMRAKKIGIKLLAGGKKD